LNSKKKFADLILSWSKENPRTLPWVGIKDVYKIWISEIMLQQTQAATVIPYYKKFIKKYPSITHLANADETELMKLWEGLGYYSRARNLLYTAKQIVYEYNGKFPQSSAELQKLKGIGQYTAAAIASFAFSEDVSAVDGNVIRILSRVFGLISDSNSKLGKENFQNIANTLLPKGHAAEFNQAMMDLGSGICKSKNPDCLNCPISSLCYAKKHGRIQDFPIKGQKKSLKKRYFHYFIIQNSNSEYWIHVRLEKDIWRGLHEFYLVEKDTKTSLEKLYSQIKTELKIKQKPTLEFKFSQKLTHQHIFAYFYAVKGQDIPLKDEFFLVKKDHLKKFAFPKSMLMYINSLS
jgi:A/G-specific adenine glycosylase